ncbi:maltose phosphorylase [Listeria fleischmannii 1991]|uniref:Kojibiose phosphorylase n=2 Tax=Listeria fleischmannii TaxID=1069827 RepID=A0A2X3H4W3_9LIST|nr:glycoside hydrolase family 65 protein [Listeria fleischmannii]KMT59410.1 maltose phosphorylase [Listeria fleischmannii 1991]SQC67501.1 Kojibiose phosphorylase [Listeria fleischmannii subsp. fleischmannii]
MRQRLFEIDPWKLKTKELNKKHKRLQESLTSIGNGYMGMRGNFEEGYSGDTHQGTYIAGVWFPDKTRVGWWKNGYPDYFGKVINALNFIGIEVIIDGEKLDLYTDVVLDFDLTLDMKNGLLTRSFIVQKNEKRYQIEATRFLSIKTRELAVMKYCVTPLDGDAELVLAPFLDGEVQNEDANYEEMFWEPVNVHAGEANGFLTTRTIPNDFQTERFTVHALMENHLTGVILNETVSQTPFYTEKRYQIKAEQNETVTLEKRVIITTSRDTENLEEKAMEILKSLAHVSYEELVTAHKEAWQERFMKADVVITGDDSAQQGIRFNIFQLFSTYYGEDARLNIGPKGFTGEKYGGATYWDTEAFALPMYLALTNEEVPRNLLKYRFNQLEEAKQNARKIGLDGALYPMVTFTGIECHNEWEITFEEIHRNGTIAYAIYNYMTYTGDQNYLNEYGIDVLVEISRFWADRVHLSDRLSKYMIHGVTGPNEYENNVNNNWFTNYIATWTLKFTLENLDQKAQTRLHVRDEEIQKWQDIIKRMYFPYDEKWQIFIQHDTFLDKELRATDTLTEADLPLNQNWSWDKILRSCFIKQADVLQGIYYFPNHFDFDTKQRNFEFYEPLTVHESSLSPAIHAVLASEIGKYDKAVEMYERTARLDLDNYNQDTEDGLHITSMAGSWLAIVQGFAGMRTTSGKLEFAPFLPESWQNYSFKINYRNARIEVLVEKEQVRLKLLKGTELAVFIYGEKYLLSKEDLIVTSK